MTSRRLFGSLRQRESGRWQIRYRAKNGMRVSWPETYARRADAAKVLAELQRQAQIGGPLLEGSSKVLFGAYAEQWLTDNPRLRPRTLEVYRSLYRRHLAPTFASVPLGQLDTRPCGSGGAPCSGRGPRRRWWRRPTGCCARC